MWGAQGTLYRSLRSEIEQNRKKHGYTLSKLGELTGINPGSLSEILNGNPPRAITIGQLDTLAKVFGHDPGWLYELYPEECISEGRISRPRLIPYLIRCVEVGRKDCIEATVPQMMENPKNIMILFALAEQLYEKGQRKESVPFYNYVIENEKDSYSDHFVMSQYRLFRVVLGTNAEENWENVIRFSPYRNRLPENYQLDALFQLAKICFALQKWERSEQYADELRLLADTVYRHELDRMKRKKKGESLKTERHLVYYYGLGHLYKSVSLEMQGLYEEAKKYVQVYADLGWFELLDEDGRKEVERFKVWAKANSYTLEVLSGNTSIIEEYADYLDNLPTNEVLAGLNAIMKSANTYHFCVDEILERFASQIASFDQFTEAIGLDRHLRFRYQMAIYEFGKGRMERGIEETIYCLSLADLLNRHDEALTYITLFGWLGNLNKRIGNQNELGG
ncbi:helix-turn-helix transcriptional regulator [Brevibacillus formosus]|uniref:DNA-binding protein n=1 Tax=Brevibacillus formosus TaxID=54913 RepID=A0A837KNI0_9BACL|nr:helix-turn-helix transcriptional regulator [Brevibacillus formosus]KLH99168.1 DNA-binding protein [Brevibacillus formosus]MED1956567.1 helix-turn-helix transcriptional regulator [Brevibacillus formosus]PSJ98198.1 XRE family transcriptional regulator [Brevibacillus formosus]